MTPFPMTRATVTFLIGLAVVTIRAGQPPPSVPAISEASDLAHAIVETPRINEVRLSPTGSHVVFARSRASVIDNSYVTELVLQALDGATDSPDSDRPSRNADRNRVAGEIQPAVDA